MLRDVIKDLCEINSKQKLTIYHKEPTAIHFDHSNQKFLEDQPIICIQD